MERSSMPMTMDERTAIHEASHAVMALVLRGKCHEVTIVRTRETLGHAEASSATILNDVLVCAAGAAGERIVCGRAAPGSVGGDREIIGLQTGGVAYGEYLAVAEWILSIHWQAVLELSRELLVRKTMNQYDIRKAVARYLCPAERARPNGSSLRSIVKARS